ncbi:MAG: hypothetical protein Kow00107_10540 [Planctomycetota bacterium]
MVADIEKNTSPEAQISRIIVVFPEAEGPETTNSFPGRLA